MAELKVFTDLIDALGKVAGGLKAIVNLPKAERETIRHTLDETYRLIDTTLNMVIIRLGDILFNVADADFLREAARLDNYNEWMQVESAFRLCPSLRVALRETETLAGKLPGTVSTNDWDALLLQMHTILATEGEVACSSASSFGRARMTPAALTRTRRKQEQSASRWRLFAPRSSQKDKNSLSRNLSFTRLCRDEPQFEV